MINGARDAIRLARYHPMFRWGLGEGFKYGVLAGVVIATAVALATIYLMGATK